MSEADNNIPIQILDKSYTFKCSPEEQASLQRSAQFLDQKMREIRDSGKILGNEKAAIMAALNITYEFLNLQNQKENYVDSINDRLIFLRNVSI